VQNFLTAIHTSHKTHIPLQEDAKSLELALAAMCSAKQAAKRNYLKPDSWWKKERPLAQMRVILPNQSRASYLLSFIPTAGICFIKQINNPPEKIAFQTFRSNESIFPAIRTESGLIRFSA